jgi:Zn-dependent peptidase ImmA (M78 family)
MRSSAGIMETALNEVRRLTKSWELGDLPVNLSRVAAQLGVHSIVEKRIRAAGLLLADTPQNQIIVVRSSDSRCRRRFTIAHELGHILVAKAMGQSVEVFYRDGHQSTSEERLVDRVAAELLMPYDLFREAMRLCHKSANNMRWSHVFRLREWFDVSISAVRRRLLEINDISTVFIRAFTNEGPLKTVARCSIACTPDSELMFYEPPLAATQKLLDRALQGTAAFLDVSILAQDIALRMDVFRRRLVLPNPVPDEYWAIGSIDRR